MHGLVELFVHELGVEPGHDDLRAVVHERDAVAEQLAAERLRADEVHGFARIVLVEVQRRRHAGGEHVLSLAREAQTPQARDVVRARARGVVGQVNVLPSGIGQRVDEVDRAGEHIVPEVERAVHVQQEQARIEQVFQIVHGSHLTESYFFLNTLLYHEKRAAQSQLFWRQVLKKTADVL